MRVALCSTFVPFVNGGYRNIIEWLETMLLRAGHEVERIYLPEAGDPAILFKQMAAFRFIDLSAADRVICFRPQSHLIRHPHKVVWFIHHLRSFYDLWDTEYRGCPDDAEHRRIRHALHRTDTVALSEATKLFTNSQVVSDRLLRFNGLSSEVLYPPVLEPERFFHRGMNDTVVCICRLEHHKRQHLLIEALQHCRTSVRLHLAGTSGNEAYPADLRRLIDDKGLAGRVTLDHRWVTEEEKQELLADCLAAAYVPVDEDSYGYPTLEAAHSRKPLLTTTDAGGPLEFVRDGREGFVVSPAPVALAAALDQLHNDRELAAKMGDHAHARIETLDISWSHVFERLLG